MPMCACQSVVMALEYACGFQGLRMQGVVHARHVCAMAVGGMGSNCLTPIDDDDDDFN